MVTKPRALCQRFTATGKTDVKGLVNSIIADFASAGGARGHRDHGRGGVAAGAAAGAGHRGRAGGTDQG